MTEGNSFRDKCHETIPGTTPREVRVSWEGREPAVIGGGKSAPETVFREKGALKRLARIHPEVVRA